MYSMQVIFCVLYATHAEARKWYFLLCTQVSLLVCCMQVNCHPLPENNQAIQWNGMLAKWIKHVDTHSVQYLHIPILIYSGWHCIKPTECQNTIMAQDLHSMSTNNLTHSVTQCAHVSHHKAHIRHLNNGAKVSSSTAGKTHSLHNKLWRHDVN